MPCSTFRLILSQLCLAKGPLACLQVKTGNMLLDRNMECRIADFGYAKLHQTQLRKAEARGEPLSADAGTYQYMVGGQGLQVLV